MTTPPHHTTTPSMRHRLALIALLVAPAMAIAADAQVVRNAGKYGAMFSWWYEELPPQTLDPATIPWDARNQRWWNAIVRQAVDARLGWLAAACWGEDTTADPVLLPPLLRAIDAAGGRLKVALFDDTTSEVLRKNRAKHGEWSLEPRFDLADLEGHGEGGLVYFYDQQWKRYFETVPDRYRLKVNGRPVVFMWHGGFEWYTNQSSFHALVHALRAATRCDFGVDPFIITEESWRRLDPRARPDGLQIDVLHALDLVPGCRQSDRAAGPRGRLQTRNVARGVRMQGPGMVAPLPARLASRESCVGR